MPIEPSHFLVSNIAVLPHGRALDVAMGEGRNAIFLAQHGYDVLGVDRSADSLQIGKARTAAAGVAIATEVVDLEIAGRSPRI